MSSRAATRTVATPAPGGESTVSGAPRSLRAGSSSTPRKDVAAQARSLHHRRVLADAAGEDDGVEPAHRRRHRGDRRRRGDGRRRRAPVPRAPRRGAAAARTSRMSAVPARPSRPASRSRARSIASASRPRWRCTQSSRPGVDRARPGRHHQAVERGEAHRRVDRAPACARRPARRPRRGGR